MEEHINNDEGKAAVDELRADLVSGGFGDVKGGQEASEVFSAADDQVVSDFIGMFGAEGDTPLKAYDWKANIPASFLDNKEYQGNIYGIIRPESFSVYILEAPRYQTGEYLIGRICSEKEALEFEAEERTGLTLVGYFDNEDKQLKLNLYESGEKAPGKGAIKHSVRLKLYDMTVNLFSRNSGLLESSEMLNKRAIMIGCGSVGSFAAMELARSGVGKFVLVDTDTLEIHNICRHQCGFEDLGRYKVDAVKDRILNINPFAEVITFRLPIERIPESEITPLLGRDTVVIGGGDNRASSEYGCRLAAKTDSAFISSCCWTRAFAGEIFYWVSGRGLSCYKCALGGLVDDARPESHHTYFGEDEDKHKVAFEPGVAADIDFVTIIAVKLALDLINRDNPNYTPRLVNSLRQYTWICNTNSPRIGGEKAEIFSYPLQITRNLQVQKKADCPYCGGQRDSTNEGA